MERHKCGIQSFHIIHFYILNRNTCLVLFLFTQLTPTIFYLTFTKIKNYLFLRVAYEEQSNIFTKVLRSPNEAKNLHNFYEAFTKKNFPPKFLQLAYEDLFLIFSKIEIFLIWKILAFFNSCRCNNYCCESQHLIL